MTYDRVLIKGFISGIRTFGNCEPGEEVDLIGDQNILKICPGNHLQAELEGRVESGPDPRRVRMQHHGGQHLLHRRRPETLTVGACRVGFPIPSRRSRPGFHRHLITCYHANRIPLLISL